MKLVIKNAIAMTVGDRDSADIAARAQLQQAERAQGWAFDPLKDPVHWGFCAIALSPMIDRLRKIQAEFRKRQRQQEKEKH